MIKEEEKAIERLNNYKEYILKCGNKKSKHFKAVVTVLNILKEKDKEIEHWKKGFERELEDNRKNTCELLKQDLIIREKDKQIDLILDVFFKRFTAQLVLEYGIENKEQLKQKFEQYFERQGGNKVGNRSKN